MRRANGKNMIYLITSVGQLNFFHWAMENRVIDYCIEHLKEIKKDFDIKQNQPMPEDGKRRKLSNSRNPSSFLMHKVCILSKFYLLVLHHIQLYYYFISYSNSL
jgi:hypothetical protein